MEPETSDLASDGWSAQLHVHYNGTPFVVMNLDVRCVTVGLGGGVMVAPTVLTVRHVPGCACGVNPLTIRKD